MPEKPNDLAIIRQINAPDFKLELERALPNAVMSGLSADRMVRLAITMLRRNDALQKCTPISVMSCVVEIAQLGLEPEGVLGHAYMVPFADQCTLIVGYRGFMHLMYQSGIITEVSAEIVRKGDKFQRVLGTERQLVHVPSPIPAKDEEKDWIGAYAVAHFLGNATPAFEYLEKAKIYQARARSRGYQKYVKDGKSTPWITDPEEMWKKTPIRRLAKRMPTSTSDKRPQLLRAVMLDEYSEKAGLLMPTLHGFEVNPDPPDQPNSEPLQPTIEVSTEDVKKSEPVKKQAAKSPAGKKADPPPNPAVPRAQIPKADDPIITTSEQTQIYNKAAANNWKIPEEVKTMLKKKFDIDSVKLVRRSMLPKIFQIIETGT
jgi:recombination protein RecT